MGKVSKPSAAKRNGKRNLHSATAAATPRATLTTMLATAMLSELTKAEISESFSSAFK